MEKSRISTPSDLSSLVPALSALLERASSGPIQLSVCLTDSEEIAALKARVAVLEAELSKEHAIRVRAENRFADQTSVNLLLLDLCREAGVKIPSYIARR